MSRSLLRGTLGLLAAGALTLGWALGEARAHTLRRYTVPVLPPGSTPVRILHLADLHLLPGDRRRIDWVKKLAHTEPHLVVNTGDNFAHRDSLPAVLEALSPFLHLPGAFVTGSNDYYLPVLKNPLRYFKKRIPSAPTGASRGLPAAEFVAMLQDHGWHYLDNARGTLTVNGTRIELVGTGDAHIGEARYPSRAGGPEATGSTGATEHTGTIRIGVTHAPYSFVLQRMLDDGVDLALAGHTHGGQVCVPGYGALVTNCDISRQMAKGLHLWPSQHDAPERGRRMWLHVSAGLGTSPFTPIRLACRPEASLITLVPR